MGSKVVLVDDSSIKFFFSSTKCHLGRARELESLDMSWQGIALK